MKASKLLIGTLAGLLVMAGAGQAAHAQKQKKSTFYVPRPERNFAQNLGGYSMDEKRYTTATGKPSTISRYSRSLKISTPKKR